MTPPPPSPDSSSLHTSSTQSTSYFTAHGAASVASSVLSSTSSYFTASSRADAASPASSELAHPPHVTFNKERSPSPPSPALPLQLRPSKSGELLVGLESAVLSPPLLPLVSPPPAALAAPVPAAPPAPSPPPPMRPSYDVSLNVLARPVAKLQIDDDCDESYQLFSTPPAQPKPPPPAAPSGSTSYRYPASLPPPLLLSLAVVPPLPLYLALSPSLVSAVFALVGAFLAFLSRPPNGIVLLAAAAQFVVSAVLAISTADTRWTDTAFGTCALLSAAACLAHWYGYPAPSIAEDSAAAEKRERREIMNQLSSHSGGYRSWHDEEESVDPVGV